MKQIVYLLFLFLLSSTLLFSEPNEEFLSYASQNNLEGIKSTLANGADINVIDELECNALMFAAMYGYTDIAKFLLESNIKPDTADFSGNTPLLFAVQNGYFEIVELLVNVGADVNKKDDYDRTALHYAANYGYTDILKLLIRSGAQLEVKNKNDNTPMNLAEMNMDIDIVRILKEEIENRKFQ